MRDMNQPARTEAEKRISPLLLLLIFPTILVVGLVIIITQVSMHPNIWLLISITICILIYLLTQGIRRQLQRTSMTLQFSSKQRFHEQFIAFLHEAGFRTEHSAEHTYVATLTSHARLGIGPLRFPPLSWCRVDIAVTDTHALLRGSTIIIQTIRNTLKQRTTNNDTITLPY